ncbi:MAG: 3'(2'),5'-bisphosphate nucleotidase CysQ [Longimicrobiales bacterium]|nr:3'(2'),5'-bisphosphate nucleotidase CysQ [Longimicrobiales bacterium]
MTGPPGYRADLELALAGVVEAAGPIMATFRTDPEVRHKGPDQPVTDADLAADALLRERLTGERPGYGWLSEESVDSDARLDRARVWIADPIDGTRSYIQGYREFAVSVALAERGRPVVGVIYNPAAAHVVWAVAGAGARSLEDWDGALPVADAGAELDLSQPGDGADRTLLASRSERADGEFEPFAAGWSIRELGSTAWKMAAVALGRGSYISRGPKSEWDVAAGVLIIREAGGVVTDLRGERIALNRPEPYVHGVVAGRPGAHRRLLERARGLASPRLHRDAWKGDEQG